MSCTSLENAVSLVPPRRLGNLLSSARAQAGLTLGEVVERSDGEFTMSELASIERGSCTLEDQSLGLLVQLYGLDSSHLIPERSRLIVDLDEGLLRVDRNRTKVSKHADHGEVLARYLAMVYSMRHVQVGTQVPLRVEDVETLGAALRRSTTTIETDLSELMLNGTEIVGQRARLFHKRLLVPAAGVLVAFCGAGALILTHGPDSPTAPVQQIAASVMAPQIGTAVVQERSADGVVGPVVERTPSQAGTATDSEVGLIAPAVLER